MLDIKTGVIIKVVVVLAAALFVYLLRDVLVILFLAIVIASAVHPFVNWLETKRIPRLLAVIVLYLVLAALIGVFISLVVPVIASELNQLGSALPNFLAVNVGFITSIQGVLDGLAKFLQVSSGSVINVIVEFFGGVVSFLAILVISFYLSVMRQGMPDFLRSVLPDAYEPYAVGLWRRVEFKMGRWFQGQLLLALTMGLMVFIGLSLFHLKYALLLAIVAMVFELVPVVGPVLSAIPAVALGFAQSPGLGIGLIVFYTIMQQTESHVLAPLILGRTLGLHPVTVVIALLIGGKLAGILGVLIAVPAAVVIVEALDDVAEQRQSRRLQGRLAD